MRSSQLFLILVSLTFLAFSGCSVIWDGGVQQNYVLPVPYLQAQTPALPIHLKVMPVVVASGLDTTRIALVENDVKVNYLASSRWVEPLPQMLQFLWIQALKQSGLATSVGSDYDRARSNRLIQITASAFNAVRTNAGDIVVHVNYEVKVMAPITYVVLSVEDSVVEERAPSSDMDDVMQTFNKANTQAMQNLLKELYADLKGI